VVVEVVGVIKAVALGTLVVAAAKVKLQSNIQPLWGQRKLSLLVLAVLLGLAILHSPAALVALVTSLCMSIANAALYACASWRSITRGINQVSCGEESHELRDGAEWRDCEYH
jgi:hypothetical protein